MIIEIHQSPIRQQLNTIRRKNAMGLQNEMFKGLSIWFADWVVGREWSQSGVRMGSAESGRVA